MTPPLPSDAPTRPAEDAADHARPPASADRAQRQGDAGAAARPSPSALAPRPPVRPAGLVKSDLLACRQLIQRHSRSFYFSSLLLPRAQRLDAWALYAFCRHADDTVDGENAGDGTVPSDADTAPHELLARVAALRARLARVYGQGAAPPAAGTVPPHTLDSPIDRAFADVVARTGLPQAVPAQLLAGMEMDARGDTYASWDDLLVYCFRVASTVGLMMTYVLGHRMPPCRIDGTPDLSRADEVYLRACDLGLAMQLTNIARDVGEDARRGRVYLPDELLAQHGLHRDAILALAARGATAPPALRRAIAELLRRADAHYHAARAGIPMLQPGGWLAIRSAERIYRAIGERLQAQGCDSLSVRARVSGAGKLWRMGGAWLAGLRPEARVLPAVRTQGPADDLLRRLCHDVGVL